MRNRSSHKKDSTRNLNNMSNIPTVNMFNASSSIIIDNSQPSQPNTQRVLTQSDMNSSQILSNTSQILPNNNNDTSQYLKKSAVIEKDRHTPSFNNKQSSYFQQNQGGYFGESLNKSQVAAINEGNTTNSQSNNSTQKNSNLQQNTLQQLQTLNSLNRIDSNTQIQLNTNIQQNNQQTSSVLTHSSSFSNLSSSKPNLNNSINHNRQSSVLKSSINGSINQNSNALNQTSQYSNTLSHNNNHQQQKSHLQQHPPLPHSSSSIGLANTNRGQLHHIQNSISSHLNNSLLRDDKRSINNTTLDSARDTTKRNPQNTNSSILKPHYFSTADYIKCNTQRSLSHNNSTRDVNQLQTSRDTITSSQNTNEMKNKENYKPQFGESTTTRLASYLH